MELLMQFYLMTFKKSYANLMNAFFILQNLQYFIVNLIYNFIFILIFFYSFFYYHIKIFYKQYYHYQSYFLHLILIYFLNKKNKNFFYFSYFFLYFSYSNYVLNSCLHYPLMYKNSYLISLIQLNLHLLFYQLTNFLH